MAKQSTLTDIVTKEDRWLARDGIQAGTEIIANAAAAYTLADIASGWSAILHLGAQGAQKLGLESSYIRKGEAALGAGLTTSCAINSLSVLTHLATGNLPYALYNAFQAASDGMILYNVYGDLRKEYGKGKVISGALEDVSASVQAYRKKRSSAS